MEKLMHTLIGWLQMAGLAPESAEKWAVWTAMVVAVVGAAVAYCVLKFAVEPIINKFTEKTETKIDDILFRDAFLQWVWWLIAFILLGSWLPAISHHAYPALAKWLQTLVNITIIGISTKAIVEFLKGVFLVAFDKERVEEEAQKIKQSESLGEEYQYTPSHSLKGLQQMVCIIVIGIGVLLMIATLLGKSPILLISGLSAGAAILMLVFKDSILGVVAGIQLTVNDMLRPGDWIVAPNYGANGRVQEVTLATVKVLNWDHTIITIPPYNLISGSFQNYRKMEETGGRRVARAFYIDMTTVRFLTPEEVAKVASEPWAAGINLDERHVNLSLFRRYLEYYIAHLPTLRPSMLYMVRELAPTPQGLPIEMYFFTSETTWHRFENVQSAVLDHVLAIVHDFDLALFQSPTGADVSTRSAFSAAASSVSAPLG